MNVLKAEEITVRILENNILNKVSFTIREGEQWAITGPSGSGKTTLLKALMGRQCFSGHLRFNENDPATRKKMVMVEQQHHFRNLSNTSNFYYQQRFNSQDADDAITVAEDLQQAFQNHVGSDHQVTELTELFGIKELSRERLIQLSNGENKRLQIVKALLQQPAFLLLDNPFTGLDVKARQHLEEILHQVGKKGVHVIMVTSASHLPFFITNVLSLSADGCR